MNYREMGRRIRCFRLERELTQEELAGMAGISPSFMGHIERGTRTASLETVMALCEALQVTPNDLLYQAGENAHPGAVRIAGDREMLLRDLTILLKKYEIDG